VARYQQPNPYDLLFFAADAAQRRLGLPGTTAHLHLELDGHVDLDGLRRAFDALRRRYPVLGARCEVSAWTGRPRWRLDGSPRPADVRVHTLANDECVQATDRLLNRPIDGRRHDPVELHVLRCRTHDIVALRWTHALMDGRGGLTVLEELHRLWHDPVVEVESSAGDEERDSYGRILSTVSRTQRWRAALRLLTGRTARGPVGVPAAAQAGPVRRGPVRHILRVLTPADRQRVEANAARTCPDARLSDYLRATGVRALHESMPAAVSRAAVYTLLAYIDNRRHFPGAVCWNLTSALPLVAPVELAMDRARLARLLREQMENHHATGTAAQDALNLWLITRLPTAWLAALARGAFARDDALTGRLAMRAPLSLPLGILGPFAQPLPVFCGRPLRNYYAFRAPLPRPGFAIDVQLTADGLNVVGVCLEACLAVERLSALIDRFVTLLLFPETGLPPGAEARRGSLSASQSA